MLCCFYFLLVLFVLGIVEGYGVGIEGTAWRFQDGEVSLLGEVVPGGGGEVILGGEDCGDRCDRDDDCDGAYALTSLLLPYSPGRGDIRGR